MAVIPFIHSQPEQAVPTQPNGSGTWQAIEFADFPALLTALDDYEERDAAGTLVANGGWTPGQIADHCALLLKYSLDGFPFKAPLPLRVFGPLLKRRILGPKPFPKGIKLRGSLRAFVPADGVPIQPAFDDFRTLLRRVTEGGEQITHRSPLFGNLTHAEWERLQTKHAAHHFGYLA